MLYADCSLHFAPIPPKACAGMAYHHRYPSFFKLLPMRIHLTNTPCTDKQGNVVISLNPFKQMSIYDQKTIDKYLSRSNFDPKLEPHIYALADNVRTIKTSLFWSFFLGGRITDREFKFNLRRIFPLTIHLC